MTCVLRTGVRGAAEGARSHSNRRSADAILSRPFDEPFGLAYSQKYLDFYEKERCGEHLQVSR